MVVGTGGGAVSDRQRAATRALPRVLTVAGSDSGGGAGIQADLKTFQRFGVYGMSALTLVTVQNTVGVSGIHLLDPATVAGQIAAVAGDIGVDAAKTGALGSIAIIEAVADALARHRIANLVVDPVMISKHGDPLLPDEAVGALIRHLLPLARVVTPNLHEARVLSGRAIDTEADMGEAARAIRDLGAAAVVVKGGRGLGREAVDVVLEGEILTRLPAPVIDTRHTHGSGCTYSAAITALLAGGTPLVEAATRAKAFLSRAIGTAPGLGSGRGPVNHWA